jgi:hypothetical protein
MDAIIIIGVSIGATSALWAVIIKISGQGILDKLNRDWKEKQEKEILQLNASIKNEENFTKNLLNIYKSSTDEIQRKRIIAIEQIWENTMDIKDKTSGLQCYKILTDAEFHDPKYTEFIEKCVREITPSNEMIQTSIELRKKERPLRLFVNDKTWKIYNIYTFFLIRSVINIHLAKSMAKKIPHWKDDEIVKKHLQLVLPSNELDQIYALSHGSYNFIQAYFEALLLNALHREITGEFQIRDQKDLFNKISEDISSDTLTLANFTEMYEFERLKMGLV